MRVMDAIRQRRSVRNYKPDPIPQDVLDRLLEAVRLAPSAGNRQPRRFVVVRDRATKVRLAEACTFARPSGETRSQRWIAEAPVVIVACGSESAALCKYYKDGRPVIAERSAVDAELRAGNVEHESCLAWDLAIALDHLSLAAVEEGLGTCWIGALDERQVKQILSIPEEVRAPLAMTVGYPASWPEPRPRKPLEEIACYDVYAWPPAPDGSP